MIPLLSSPYPQSTYIITRNHSFSSSSVITGDTPVYSIESGDNSPDLTLNSDSGVISGSPSQSITTQNVIIKAENPVSDQSFNLSFTTRILPTLFHYPQEVYYTPINKPFSITPECDGDYLQYSLEEGSLPSGLSLDSSSGVIEESPINSTHFINSSSHQ